MDTRFTYSFALFPMEFSKSFAHLASVQIHSEGGGLPHSLMSGESGGTSDRGIGVVFQ